MRSKSIDTMKKIKTFAEEYYMLHYQSPSMAQIAENVGIARSTAYKYLIEMDHRGMISYDGKKIRTEIIDHSNPKMIRAAVLEISHVDFPMLQKKISKNMYRFRRVCWQRRILHPASKR